MDKTIAYQEEQRGSVAGSIAKAPQKESEVTVALAELEKSNESLAMAVFELIRNIDPVLAPEQVTQESPTERSTVDSYPQSEIGMRIRESSNRLYYLSEKVNETIARVRV